MGTHIYISDYVCTCYHNNVLVSFILWWLPTERAKALSMRSSGGQEQLSLLSTGHTHTVVGWITSPGLLWQEWLRGWGRETPLVQMIPTSSSTLMYNMEFLVAIIYSMASCHKCMYYMTFNELPMAASNSWTFIIHMESLELGEERWRKEGKAEGEEDHTYILRVEIIELGGQKWRGGGIHTTQSINEQNHWIYNA